MKIYLNQSDSVPDNYKKISKKSVSYETVAHDGKKYVYLGDFSSKVSGKEKLRLTCKSLTLLLITFGSAYFFSKQVKANINGKRIDSLYREAKPDLEKIEKTSQNILINSPKSSSVEEVPIQPVPQLKEKYPFKPIYEIFADTVVGEKNIKECYELLNKISKDNQSLKLKMEGNKILLGHTPHEMLTLCSLHKELFPYFFNSSRSVNILDPSGKSNSYSTNGIQAKFYDPKLPVNLDEIPPVVKAKPMDLPSLPNFTGTDGEIKEVFTSLLKEAQGILVGEASHHDLLPKQVLKEQMQHLYDLGVRTLFLEHCCLDTLQNELDLFFNTKNSSPFLKQFLSKACGGAVMGPTNTVNYYDFVKAAVDAGIRPVGLEYAVTQGIGFDKWSNSGGETRMRAFNLAAQHIIEEEKGEGKYIALVGSAHVSYCCNIPGLSELCDVPSLVIRDTDKKPFYHPNTSDLDFSDKSILNNDSHHTHFCHAHIGIPESRMDSNI